MDRIQLARFIDHTLLKPDATSEQIHALCREAVAHGFASVCVNPSWVRFCGEELAGRATKVCTVIGFPLGATTPATKANEAMEAVSLGAHEVDMVVNIGAIKSHSPERVAYDVRAVRQAIGSSRTLKVIIETCLLTDAEKVVACKIARENGADFVKTSTGFSTGGATTADVRLMRETVGQAIGVKASGGIKDFATAMSMIEAGANRLGIGQAGSLAIMAGAGSETAY
jgi:deoxyribose-phosphate aldolase